MIAIANDDLSEQRFGGLSYDSSRRILLNSTGESVPIRAQSLKVFRYLAERPGTVVPRAELFTAVWGNTAVTDDSLVQCISDIRRVLGENAHEILKTVPRRGYMLVADPIPATNDTTAVDGVIVPLHRRPVIILSAFALIVCLIWISQHPEPSNTVDSGLQAADSPLVAATFDSHDNNNAVALAITIELPADTNTARLLTDVLAETRISFNRYRTVKLVPDADAEQILRLSSSSAGRILTELVDVASGDIIASEAHEVAHGSDDAPHQLARRIAAVASPGGGAIMRRILHESRLKPVEELTRRECYALGFECTACSGELSTVTPRAVSCLAETLKRHPDDARGWALQGSVLANQYWWGSALSEPAKSNIVDRTGLPARALAAANRAESLSDGADSAVYWGLALGYASSCDVERLETAVDRALAINPDDPNMLGGLGNWLAYNGSWEKGVAMAEKAINLQPVHHKKFWHYAIAKNHYRLGEYQAAYDAFSRAFDDRNWLNHLQLAYTLPHLGRVEEARSEIAEVQRLFPGFTIEMAIEFYRMFCFDDAYLDQIETALELAELASRGDASNRENIKMPRVKLLKAAGTTIEYLDIGHGEPVVFVHGSISDYRSWAHFQLPVSESHRYIAYSRRYHGSQDWPDDGEHYSRNAHANELIEFIEALDIGPVHLVGWSSGSVIAPLAALRRPDLALSLVLYEPTIGELIPQDAEHAAITEEFYALWEPVYKLLQSGDVDAATKRFLEAAFNLAEGGFEMESLGLRTINLENARTVPINMNQARPTDAEILDCVALADLDTPTLVLTGEHTYPFWSEVSDQFVKCAPDATATVVSGVNHDGPVRVPRVIVDLMLEFIDGLKR